MNFNTNISKAQRMAFATHLYNYLNMAEDTEKASIAAYEAEQRKQQIYSEECKQRDAVLELWKKLRKDDWRTQAHFKLPDGRIVEIHDNLIFECKVTDI